MKERNEIESKNLRKQEMETPCRSEVSVLHYFTAKGKEIRKTSGICQKFEFANGGHIVYSALDEKGYRDNLGKNSHISP